jgi:hypothetical protein
MLDFDLKSEFQTIHRRSFELATPAILNPNNANPLIMGEFLQLNTSYKMARGSGTAAAVPSFCYFAEQGRYETQAIGKGPFLFGGFYEADTKVMDATLGATIATVGQPLVIGDISIGGQTRRGLRAVDSAGTDFVVGYVTRLPADNNGYLRFISCFTGI